MTEVKNQKTGLQTKLDASHKQIRELERLVDGQRQQISSLEQTVSSLRSSEQDLENELGELDARVRHVQSIHEKVGQVMNSGPG